MGAAHDRAGRIFHAIFTASGRRVVILRAFVKKTQQTPAREIDIARQRAKESDDEIQHSAQEADEGPGIPQGVRRTGGGICADRRWRRRAPAGLSQAQLAKRMKTTQSAVARLESGRGKPSTRTLARFAKATGHRLKISFEPVRGDADALRSRDRKRRTATIRPSCRTCPGCVATAATVRTPSAKSTRRHPVFISMV